MPQILIITDDQEVDRHAVVYRERLAPSDFESSHFTGQLAERVGWAVSDAERLEHADGQDVAVVPEAGRAN